MKAKHDKGEEDVTRTTILLEVAISAMVLAHSSQFLMLAALPAPIPVILVGVLTLMKIMSASRMASLMFVEKNKFLQWVGKELC